MARYFGKRYPYLSAMGLDVEILAVPCVGSGEYLLDQMRTLDKLSGYVGLFPTIISSSFSQKRNFAATYVDHLDLWAELKRQTSIEFDLLYAPRSFEIILSSHLKRPFKRTDLDKPLLENWLEGSNVIYYHCGGQEGNCSQLARYDKLLAKISRANLK